MRIKHAQWIVLALAGLFGQAPFAATIYRWVDESGRYHASDVVPDRYRSKAVPVDTRAYEIPAAREFAAQRALAQQRSRLDVAPPRNTPLPAPPLAAIPAGGPLAAAALPDCTALRRAYRESQECFAPFHNANGSVKAEAFDKCTPVDDPSFQCGIPTAAE